MKYAKTTTLNHGRSGHANGGALCGNANITGSKESRITCEAIAIVNGDARYFSSKASPTTEGCAVETSNIYLYVSVTRASTAALGIHHKRQPLSLGNFKNTVELVVVKEALCSGKHAVVVNCDGYVSPLIR